MIAVSAFIVLAVIFVGFGGRLARLIGLGSGPVVERLALSFVLSVGAVTLVVFGLAIAHVVTPWTCLLVAVVMGIASIGVIRAEFRELRAAAWRGTLWPGARLDRVLVILIGAFLGSGLVMALAPPTGMDTGVYHFTIPKIILQDHGLISRDDIWVHKSGGFYMVYVFGMALGGEIVSKLLAFAMAVAGVGLCSAVADRLRPGTGRLGAFILLSTPLSAGYLGYEYLELPILTYVLAAVLAILRGPEGRAWTVLACGLTGLAISVKPSAFAVAILAPAALGSMLMRDRGRGAFTAIVSLAILAATAGFWSIWNYATTGALVYRYPGTAMDSGLLAPAGNLWSGVVHLLVHLATTGLYWTDSAGPFIVGSLAGFALFLWKGERRIALLLCFTSLAGYIGGLAVLAPTQLFADFGARYFAPCLVGFGAPVAAQFAGWVRERPGLLRTAIVVALLVPAAPLLVLKAGKAAVAAPVAVGLESRSAYLGKKIETFAACEVLNRLPSPDVKVLFVGVRPYYLDRPFVWIPYIGPIPFLRGVKTREDFVRRVRDQGITHVLYEPTPSREGPFTEPDLLLGPPFRELGRWPWKLNRWVRLYVVERP